VIDQAELVSLPRPIAARSSTFHATFCGLAVFRSPKGIESGARADAQLPERERRPLLGWTQRSQDSAMEDSRHRAAPLMAAILGLATETLVALNRDEALPDPRSLPLRGSRAAS